MIKILLFLVSVSFLSCGQDIPIPSLAQTAALPNGSYAASTFYCLSDNQAISVVNGAKAASIHHFNGTKTYTVNGDQFEETYTNGSCTMVITRTIILNKGNTLGLRGKTYNFTGCTSGIQTNSTTPVTYYAASFANSSTETLYWMVAPYTQNSATNYRLEGNIFDLQEFGCQIADQFIVLLTSN